MSPAGAGAAKNTKSAITNQTKNILPLSSPPPVRHPLEKNHEVSFISTKTIILIFT